MDVILGKLHIEPAKHWIRFTKEEVVEALLDYVSNKEVDIPAGSVSINFAGGGFYVGLQFEEVLDE